MAREEEAGRGRRDVRVTARARYEVVGAAA